MNWKYILVEKIHTETYNVTEVYITADHGFLFNDQQFEEKDKHKVTEPALENKTRYYLTTTGNKVARYSKTPLAVSGMNAENIYMALCRKRNNLLAANLEDICLLMVEHPYKK